MSGCPVGDSIPDSPPARPGLLVPCNCQSQHILRPAAQAKHMGSCFHCPSCSSPTATQSLYRVLESPFPSPRGWFLGSESPCLPRICSSTHPPVSSLPTSLRLPQGNQTNSKMKLVKLLQDPILTCTRTPQPGRAHKQSLLLGVSLSDLLSPFSSQRHFLHQPSLTPGMG